MRLGNRGITGDLHFYTSNTIRMSILSNGIIDMNSGEISNINGINFNNKEVGNFASPI